MKIIRKTNPLGFLRKFFFQLYNILIEIISITSKINSESW